MPFQPMNFANIAPQGNPFMRDLVGNLVSGYKAGQVPAQLNRQRQEEELKNAFQSMLNEEQPEKFRSEMMSAAIQRALGQANADKINTMTPLEAAELSLKNQFYPELTRQQIESAKALAAMRQLGGSGVGAGGKEELLFQNLVRRDNPGLTDDQVYEASNVLRQGGDTLSDGTKLSPLSPASQASFDRLTKYGTTSPLITGNIQGAQSEAEIDALAKHAQAGIRPYGDTYAGYSPAQIIDTFKNDKESQERLGRFIAAKQLQFEIAQNQIRLANGKPGVTTTQELMDLGMQNIKGAYPMLSGKAREAAQNYFIEGLKKGFQARKQVGLGASSSFSQPGSSSSKAATVRYNPATGKLEEIR
jgi:hypothetical protein